MPTPKPWYESKTIWLNVLMFVAAALLLISQSPLFEQWAAHIALVQGLVNIILRLITEQPIGKPEN